ncbi:MAG: hypothetical protein ACQRW7_03475 [Caulobacterales bacterium]|uniref:hypothetical protein n=1 Tax=Glycocaulis sp. TaxID=1969725 RepID=UPI003FA0F7A5
MTRLPARKLAPFVLAGTLVLFPGLAGAQDSGSPLVDTFLACRTIADDAERHACLDRTSAAMAEALQSGEISIVERERAVAAERGSFGTATTGTGGFLTALLGRTTGDMSRVQAYGDGTQAVRSDTGEIEALLNVPVQEAGHGQDGKLYVVLSDGQVWRQTDTRRIHLPRNTSGLTVSIRRGAVGSYFMSLSNSPLSVRARRD